MKNLITKLNLNIMLILLTCNLAAGQSEDFEVVAPEKIPEVLKMIAAKTKENFERIHTWQAERDVSSYYTEKGEQAKRTFETETNAVGSCPNEVAILSDHAPATFKCNLDKGLFYSSGYRKTPIHYIDLVDGRDLGTKDLEIKDLSEHTQINHILTDEYYISSGPSVLRRNTGEVLEHSAVKQKVEKKDPSCTNCDDYIVYDPRYLFDFKSPPWRSYSGLAKVIENKGNYVNQKGEFENDGYTLKVEENKLPNDIEYTIYLPAKINAQDYNGILWIIRKHSANAVYNMISYQSKFADGPITQQKNFEYKKINGVFVPIKYTYETFDYNDFSLRHHEEQIFKNIHINEDIPAETFTYKNLDLKDGDKFIDKIESKEYKYKEANLVFVKDINETPVEKPKEPNQ